MRVCEFLEGFVERSGPLGSDEGVQFGDAKAEVMGVLVCFMATLEALGEARSEGCNLVITHETPFLPYPGITKIPDDAMSWSTNNARLREMEEGGLTVVRLHGSLDRLLVHDTFRERLGLPWEGDGKGYNCVYDAPPAALRSWIERAKIATGVERVRYVGDPDRIVSRVGLPFGGLALFVNVGCIETLIRLGANLLIGGESDDYAMRYIADSGAAFIETGHSSSENPGLARYADDLRRAFPPLKVVYHNCPVLYSWA